MQTRRIIYIRIWENVRLAIDKLAVTLMLKPGPNPCPNSNSNPDPNRGATVYPRTATVS